MNMETSGLVADTGASKKDRACGLCGAYGTMSRTHVPPRAAGNDDRVERAPDRIVGQIRQPGRWNGGGMWVRGLCRACNSRCGGDYDKAYADFSHQVRRLTTPGAQRLAIRPGSVPDVRFAPGAVVRCVLYGMFALNSGMRARYPLLAHQLATEDYRRGCSVDWPADLSLRLGLSDPRFPRSGLLASRFWAVRVLGRSQAHTSLADIVWPPLAWSLVWATNPLEAVTGEPQITDHLPDVSDWLTYGPHRNSVDLRNLVPRLPYTTHPLLTGDDTWIEMYPDRESEYRAVTVFGRKPF